MTDDNSRYLINDSASMETVIWPAGEKRSVAAAARIIMSFGCSQIADAVECDGRVRAPELLRWCRSFTPTGLLHEHMGDPWQCPTHPDGCPDGCEWEQECGCEDEGWFCPDGDGFITWAGWSTTMHCDDLALWWRDDELTDEHRPADSPPSRQPMEGGAMTPDLITRLFGPAPAEQRCRCGHFISSTSDEVHLSARRVRGVIVR